MVVTKIKDMTEQQNAKNGIVKGLNEIRFTVFGDPIPKARPRTVNGHTYTPERTRVHEEKIAMVYKSQYRDFAFKRGEPLRIVVDAYFKIAKSDKKTVKEDKALGKIRPTGVPDADNVQKAVQDAVNGLAYYDDSQIVEATVRKWYSNEPRTEIYIARVNYDE